MSNHEQHQLPVVGVRRGSIVELDHAESAWNRAAEQSVQGDPFCCRTEWQLSFHEAFYPHRQLHLREGGGSVVAFAERRLPEPGLLLEPVESDWLFGCPLLGAHAVEVLDEFLRERAAQMDATSVLISGLLPGSALPRRILETFRSRYQIFGLPPGTLCSATLEGGLDGYLSRRTGRLRRNLRQAARRAEAGGVGYERCAPRTAAAAAAIYARMLAVEQNSWKGIGRCGMAESPSREFYACMLRRLAASAAGRVMFARCGDEDIGFIFGGLAGAVYRGQQFSYAEDWSAFSIGSLLQVEQIRWLCEEGVARYDMGPLMDYKRHWTEIERRIDAWLLRPM